MFKRLLLALALSIIATVAVADCGPTNPNCIVPTRPPGDSTNAAASTAFVQNAVGGIGAGGGTSMADDTAFTQGPTSGTSFTPFGGIYSTSIQNLASGSAGVGRMTTDRRLYTFDSANLSGTAPGVAPPSTLIVGALYNSSAPVPTNGQALPLQSDVAGRLIVDCGTGCTAASQADNSIFTQGTSQVVPIAGFYGSITNITSGNAGIVQLTTDRMMYTNLGKVGGTAFALGQATMANSLPIVLPSNPDNRPASGTITVVDSGSSTTSGQNGTSIITGTATAGSTYSQAINGQSTSRIQVSGTWNANLQFEGSADGGTTWITINALVIGTPYRQTIITGNGVFETDVTGLTNVRVRATSFTSGTVTIQATFTAENGTVQVLNPIAIVDNSSGFQAGVDSSSNLKVNCTVGCSSSGGSSLTDEGTFTPGTTSFTVVGGLFGTQIAALTSGQAGAVQLTSDRMMYVNVGKWAGVALGSPSNYGTSPGVVSAVGVNAFITNIPQVDLLGNAGAIMDFAGQNATSPANSLQVGCEFNTTPTTITNGKSSPCQLDSAGNLLVNLKTAIPAGSATIGAVTQASGPWTTNETQINGSSVVTAAAGIQKVGVVGNSGSTLDSAGANASAAQAELMVGGVYLNPPTSVTSGNASQLQIDAKGSLRVDIMDAAGNGRGTNVNVNNQLNVFDASDGAIGGTVPTSATYLGVSVGGNLTGIVGDPCQTVAHTYTPISFTTSAPTTIVAGTASKKTYICGLFLFTGGAVTLAIVEGTGTNCSTISAGVIGGATSATGIALTANQGWVEGSGGYAIAATATNADNLCTVMTATQQVSGNIVTVQQ